MVYLPDEVHIIILSNISKPSHILQFALANKQMSRVAIAHLYESIIIDYEEYSSVRTVPLRQFVLNVEPWYNGDFARYTRPTAQLYHPGMHRSMDDIPHWNPTGLRKRNHSLPTLYSSKRIRIPLKFNPYEVVRYDYNAPHSNLLCLSSMIRANALPPGLAISRLTMIIGINHDSNRTQTVLSLLLPQLSSLKHLTVKTVSENVPEQEDFSLAPLYAALKEEYFSLAPLNAALSVASQTLQSLDLQFALNRQLGQDGWTIGTLRHFSQLKYLSVQGSVLLGKFTAMAPNLSLNSLLPVGLKSLRLHWTEAPGFEISILLLDAYVRESVELPSSFMEHVFIRLSVDYESDDPWGIGQAYELAVLHLNDKARQLNSAMRVVLEWEEDL